MIPGIGSLLPKFKTGTTLLTGLTSYHDWGFSGAPYYSNWLNPVTNTLEYVWLYDNQWGSFNTNYFYPLRAGGTILDFTSGWGNYAIYPTTISFSNDFSATCWYLGGVYGFYPFSIVRDCWDDDQQANYLATRLFVYDGGLNNVQSQYQIVSNPENYASNGINWNNATIVFTASTQTFDLYINGKYKATRSLLSIDHYGWDSLVFGNNPYEEADVWYPQTNPGYLGDVGVWSRKLTAAEISEYWNSGSPKLYPFS